MTFSKLFLTLSVLVATNAHARPNWADRPIQLGDELVVPQVGQCRVVAEYPGNKVSVVDNKNRVHMIDCGRKGILRIGDAQMKFRGEYSPTSNQGLSLPIYEIEKAETQPAEESQEASLEDAII